MSHSTAFRHVRRARLTRTSAIAVCLLALGVHVSAQRGAKPEPKPDPDADASKKPAIEVTVSLSRDSIREDDNVDVRIWLTNDSAQDVTAVETTATVPSFIKWREGTCASWPQTETDGAADKPIAWGKLAPHSVTPKVLCLRSGPDVVVGDFNLLFTFQYEWQQEKATHRSFAAEEKKLTVNLFGSDDIAGVPISLAGFIVPGLFFWMVLGLWKVPWMPWEAGNVPLGERLIYSVVVSIIILFVGGNFDVTDVGAGVGLWKLFYLGLIGALAGVVVGGADWVRRRWITSQAQRQAAEKERLEQQKAAEADARSIKLQDDRDVLLEKLLTDEAGESKPLALVTLKDGSVFGGALGRRDPSATGLVGWLNIELGGASADVRNQVTALVNARKWKQALAAAKTHKLKVSDRNLIWKEVGGVEEEQAHTHMTWDSAQVTSVAIQAGQGSDELISLP